MGIFEATELELGLLIAYCSSLIIADEIAGGNPILCYYFFF
jgi:hypothetical protein